MSTTVRQVLEEALDLDPALPVVDRVENVWFGRVGEARRGQSQAWWFEPSEAVDAVLIAVFSRDVGDALAGRLDALADTPRGAVTLLVLLGALPDRLWKGHAKAAEALGKARAIAIDVLRKDGEKRFSPVDRLFLALPFLRSDDPVDHDRGRALLEAAGEGPWPEPSS